MSKVTPITDEQLALLDRLEREVGIDSDSGERFDDEVLFMYPGLRERLRQGEAGKALKRLVNAALPIDMWMGGEWSNPPSPDERHEFVLALSAALSLAPVAATTSEQQQIPACPDDSVPSSRSESEDL